MLTPDTFKNRETLLGDPASDGFVIFPNDGLELERMTRGIYVGTPGDISLTTAGGTPLVFKNVPIGVLPVRAAIIDSTGTTATDMIGLV